MSKIKKVEIANIFSRLTVFEDVGRSSRREIIWLCLCECGKKVTALTNELLTGHKKSCGCLRIEIIKKSQTTHGKSKTPEYKTWCGMIKRTENQNCKSYKDYGGRGINVCDRWRNSFENFLSDMGLKPSRDHSLDRKNNNGNYSPENCRWALKDIQAKNKRNNIMVSYNGKAMILEDVARELNVTRSIAKTIVKKHYSLLN